MAKQERHEAETETRRDIREGLIGGLHGAQNVATEGVHMVRDVATDAVKAVGEIGIVALDTTRTLLVGAADGLRDVLSHAIRRPREKEPGSKEEMH